MPLIGLQDVLSESLAHSERISGLLLVGVLVIAAISIGTVVRRQVRESWLGTDIFSAPASNTSVTLANQ